MIWHTQQLHILMNTHTHTCHRLEKTKRSWALNVDFKIWEVLQTGGPQIFEVTARKPQRIDPKYCIKTIWRIFVKWILTWSLLRDFSIVIMRCGFLVLMRSLAAEFRRSWVECKTLWCGSGWERSLRIWAFLLVQWGYVNLSGRR